MKDDRPATPRAAFRSLKDAAVAIDPANEHILVVDDLQPGFEHPQAAIDEFDSKGNFIAQLKDQVIDALPSGMALIRKPAISSSPRATAKTQTPLPGDPTRRGSRRSAWGSRWGRHAPERRRKRRGPIRRKPSRAAKAQRVTGLHSGVQKGGLRVALEARLAPKKLPRETAAPVKVAVSANVARPKARTHRSCAGSRSRSTATAVSIPPVFRSVKRDMQPSTTQGTLAACRDAFVGEGKLSAKVLLSQQSPFPPGEMFAFNGVKGSPAILAHVYGTKPVPTSFTFPFLLKPAKGTYGTVLEADLPQSTGKSGYITGLSMNLGATSYKRSYISAACRAPKGFGKASFSLTEAKLSFEGHGPVSQTLQRSCGVR